MAESMEQVLGESRNFIQIIAPTQDHTNCPTYDYFCMYVPVARFIMIMKI